MGVRHFLKAVRHYIKAVRHYIKANNAGFCISFLCLLIITSSCSLFPTNTTTAKVILTLWYKNRSIDDTLLAAVDKHFPGIHLQAIKIGKDFDSKVRTAFAGQTEVPDMVGLNSNIATYFTDEDQFVDLYTLGARSSENQYLDWKWKQGQTPSGRLIGFPMDTGPTALFYRADAFQQAGLPTDPQEVSTQMNTWEAYIHAAQILQSRSNGKAYIFSDMDSLFSQVLGQLGKSYFDAAGNYIGDQSHIKYAWDLAVRVHQLHLSARIPTLTTDWSAAVSNGTLVAFVGAIWMKNYLRESATNSIGKWRVARAPGGDGNDGGSFLSVTKYSQHPREAFAIIKWLMSPQHQLQSYLKDNLFPSTPGVYNNAAMQQAEPLFGDQTTTQIFSQSAKNVKPSYFGPNFDMVNTIFEQELQLIDALNADPGATWQDTQQQVARELSR